MCPRSSAVLLFTHECAAIIPKFGDDTTRDDLIKDNNETDETTEIILDCTRPRDTHDAFSSVQFIYIAS